MRRHERTGRVARGFAFIGILFVLLLLSGLALGLLTEASAARTSVGLHESCLVALEMAETGLVHAEAEIRALTDFGSDGVGFYQGNLGDGTWSVVASQETLNPDRWTLVATGTSGHSTRRVEEVVRRRTNAMFVDALFSRDSVVLGGGTPTDSYDSRVGSYASQAVNSDAAGTYAKAGGSIGSNGDISLNGSGVRVRGNAIPGPTNEVYMSGGSSVTGDVMPRLFEVPLPPVPYSEFLYAMTNNDNKAISGGQGNTVRYQSGRMSLDIAGGATMVMPPGTFFFSDITLKGNSTIRITGPTKIYVTSLLDFAAGAQLIADHPGDVQIIAHPYSLPSSIGTITETRIKVNSGSTISWTLYGPEANLEIGGGNEFFGAAVAETVAISGGNTFHYDEALGQAAVLGAAFLERLYWVERVLPRR